jgi:hypothetical protein
MRGSHEGQDHDNQDSPIRGATKENGMNIDSAEAIE